MNDIIYNLVPVNKLASVVTQQSDSQYTPKGDTRVIRSKTPLPIESITVGKSEYSIVGERFGSFVVLGAFPLINKKKNRQWVVKCDCGYYETRRLKSLKTANKESLCCIDCQKIKKLSTNKTIDNHNSGMLLKYLCEDGSFKTRNSSFSKHFKLNDIVINQNGDKDIVIYVSNNKIKFSLGLFNVGDKIKTLQEIIK